MVFPIFKDVFKIAPKDTTYKHTIRIILDVTGFLITFCFYYCLLLFLYYFQYQVGRCDFQPLVYLASIVLFYGIHRIFYIFENPIVPSVISLLIVYLTFCLYPIKYLRIMMVAVLLIFSVMEFLTRDKKINKSGIGDALYLRVRNRVWGVGIGILMVLHTVISAGGTDRSIQPSYCLTIMSIVMCAYIVLIFMDRYLKVFHRFFRRKKLIHPVMEAQVKKVLVFAGSFATGIALIIFLLSGYFSKLLTFVFGSLIKLIAGIDIKPFDTSGQPEKIKKLEQVVNESYEERSFLSLSGTLAAKVVAIIFAVIITGLIIAGLIKFLQNLSRFTFATEEDDDISTDKREFIVSTRKSEKSVLYRHGSSFNERIRKHYSRMLKYFRKKGSLKGLSTMTCDEISNKVPVPEKDHAYMNMLTAIYEEARYSGRISEKEEAEKAKELSSRIINNSNAENAVK